MSLLLDFKLPIISVQVHEMQDKVRGVVLTKILSNIATIKSLDMLTPCRRDEGWLSGAVF